MKNLRGAYIRRFKNDIGKAEFFALMSSSKMMWEVFVYGATKGKCNYKTLIGNLETLDPRDLDIKWLAGLGRITALRSSSERDARNGLRILEKANQFLPKNTANFKYSKLEAELNISLGRFDQARDLVVNSQQLAEQFYNYLYVDTFNPYVNPDGDYDYWMSGFNRPFIAKSCSPLKVNRSSSTPFDGIEAAYPVENYDHSDGDPMVSVIMTCYSPDRDTFRTAYQSILNQTWQNWELIIIDDATPDLDTSILDEAESSDSRVTVIRLQKNGGTYRARNVGIAHAKGQFVTGQDSDDWSHPERLATQVGFMLNNPESSGVLIGAIRTDENLLRVQNGQNPNRRCEVSFLTLTETALEAGGYLDARKAADSEFRQRIEYIKQRKVDFVDRPLYLTRLVSTSLSRGDFRAGWHHPSRRVFWSSVTRWHSSASLNDLKLGNYQDKKAPVAVPNRFMATPSKSEDLDFLFVNDWRSLGSSQRSAYDEIKALQRAGFKVAVLQKDSLLSPNTSQFLNELIQDDVNSGELKQVIETDKVRVRIIFHCDPVIAQFETSLGTGIVSERILIIADTPPGNHRVGDYLYHAPRCSTNLQGIYGAWPEWCSRDIRTIEYLKGKYGRTIEYLDEILPPVIEADHLSNLPLRKSNQIGTVVGRSANNHFLEWPDPENEFPWDIDSQIDVRILGDARGYLRRTRDKFYPNNWVVFRHEELSIPAFINSLDAYVMMVDEQLPISFSREALEASIAGKVVILSDNFKATHGNAAMYVKSNQIPAILAKLSGSDSTLFAKYGIVKFNAAESTAKFVMIIERILRG